MDGFTLAAQVRRNPTLAGTRILMLTSAGQPEDVARCRALGIGAYLMKPVKQSELLETLLAALGDTPDPVRGAAPAGRPHGAGRRGLRVLLAEDNPVNQKLAVRLLEKEGHTVAVASTGREALTAVERERFDLILMDVQMPEMDGLEAAAHIRRSEAETGRHVPILAMTAYAMKGDRERCLAAGMDSYIAKPIQPGELYQAIARLVPPVAPAGPGTPSAPSTGEKVWNQVEALERVAGDAALLRELVRLFLDAYPGQVAELRAARARQDGPALWRLAHALKGAIGVFGAEVTRQAALRLETAAQAGQLSEAEQACIALEEALARLQPELAAWAK
jgi:CheY-like chemotaxis protein/HPt (histidine-containing phosphotransfer) domain-containing protein